MSQIVLNQVEIKNLAKWVEDRSSYMQKSSIPFRFELKEYPTSIGVKIVAKELSSCHEEDITDYNSW